MTRALHPRSIRLVAGMVGTTLLAGAIAVTLAYGQGYYDGGYDVTAVFGSSSQGVFTDGGTDVKMRGINVGSVAGVALLDDGRARLTLRIDDGVDVPVTAVASIEPLSVFGPKFVRIEPGEGEGAGPFLAPGDEIARTQSSTELTSIIAEATELLGAMDPGELAAVVEAVADGVTGLGDTIGTTIDDTAVLLDVGARHTADTRAFLDDLAVLSGTVAASIDDATATVADVAALAATFVDASDDLDVLLDRTVAIAGGVTVLLDDHRLAFDAIVEALARFIHGVHLSSEDLPDLLDLLGTFFGRLADVIRLQGPSGTKLAGLRGFVAIDLCLLYGICL